MDWMGNELGGVVWCGVFGEMRWAEEEKKCSGMFDCGCGCGCCYVFVYVYVSDWGWGWWCK